MFPLMLPIMTFGTLRKTRLRVNLLLVVTGLTPSLWVNVVLLSMKKAERFISLSEEVIMLLVGLK